MAVIQYNSNAIIPGPFVRISKRYDKTEDGTIIGSVFDITVIGKLVAYKGSPTSSGTFWTTSGYPPDEVIGSDSRLGSLIRKQEALRKLFSQEGQVFLIQPWDGTAPLYCNPRLKTPIEFKDGLWFEYTDYTIQLEADIIYGLTPGNEDNFGFYINKAQDDWILDPADEIGRTYRLSHVISAVGKRFYQSSDILLKPAYQNAQDWVNARLGIDTFIANSGSSQLVGWGAYNYLRAETTDKYAGTYSVRENWLMFNPTGNAPPAVEDFNVNVKIDERQRVTVDVAGQIRGLQVSDNTNYNVISSRYQNANSYWSTVSGIMFNRAQSYGGYTLNPTRLSLTLDQNFYQGVFNYSANFDNRPTTLIPGAIRESITVVLNNPNDVFSSIPVLNRLAGPVLQAGGTVTANVKELVIEAVMPALTYGQSVTGAVKPNTNTIVASFAPAATIALFLSRDIESYDPINGRYSRTTAWTWE